MKKYSISFLLLLITPCVCFGSSARYTQLVRQKQQKMEQLEKCMGSNKALQIAGVSTLGLTAVGVAGNIAEAKIIKDNEKTLEKKEATITEKTDELKKKGDDLTKAEADLENAKKSWEDARTLEKIVEQDIANITSFDVGIGSKVVTSGYDPSALPAGEQKNRLASAIIGFIRKCKQLESNGIKNVSLSDADNPTWQNTDGTISADAMTKYWDKTDEFVVMECKLVGCEELTHYRAGDECVEKEKTEQEPATTTTTDPTKTISENKSGEGKEDAERQAQKPEDENGAAKQDQKSEEEVNILQQACESSDNGGRWLGNTCDCGQDKVWNPSNKKCEDHEEQPEDEPESVVSDINNEDAGDAKKPEQKMATTPKKCSIKTLNAVNAKDGVIEGKKCKVTSCKGNLEKSGDGFRCECPSDKPKLDKKTMKCYAEKPATTVVEEKKTTADVSTWTDAYKHEHAKEYCDAKYKNQPNIHACCMEVHDTQKAFNWQKGKCVCKNNAKWENNKCVADKSDPKWTEAQKKANPDTYCKSVYSYSDEADCCMEILAGNATKYKESNNSCDCKEGEWEHIDHGYHCVRKDTYFKDVSAEAMDACKGFVKLYGKHKNMNLTFLNSKLKNKDHYLYYKTKVGKYDKYYAFQFNVCENVGGDTMPAYAIRGTLDTLCKMYGGISSWQDWAGATGHVCPLLNKEAVAKEVHDVLGTWYEYIGNGFWKFGKISPLESLYYKL